MGPNILHTGNQDIIRVEHRRAATCRHDWFGSRLEMPGCVGAWVCWCMGVWVCAYVGTWVRVQAHGCIGACVYSCMSAWMCGCMGVLVCVCVCVCVCAWVCAWVCACVRTYVDALHNIITFFV